MSINHTLIFMPRMRMFAQTCSHFLLYFYLLNLIGKTIWSSNSSFGLSPFHIWVECGAPLNYSTYLSQHRSREAHKVDGSFTFNLLRRGSRKEKWISQKERLCWETSRQTTTLKYMILSNIWSDLSPKSAPSSVATNVSPTEEFYFQGTRYLNQTNQRVT